MEGAVMAAWQWPSTASSSNAEMWAITTGWRRFKPEVMLIGGRTYDVGRATAYAVMVEREPSADSKPESVIVIAEALSQPRVKIAAASLMKATDAADRFCKVADNAVQAKYLRRILWFMIERLGVAEVEVGWSQKMAERRMPLTLVAEQASGAHAVAYLMPYRADPEDLVDEYDLLSALNWRREIAQVAVEFQIAIGDVVR